MKAKDLNLMMWMMSHDFYCAAILIIPYQVLLYKFFEDSSADLSQWRIVLNMLNEEDGLVVSAPTFDNTRHAGVCTEVSRLSVFFDPISQALL
jgi:hypothetical protein